MSDDHDNKDPNDPKSKIVDLRARRLAKQHQLLFQQSNENETPAEQLAFRKTMRAAIKEYRLHLDDEEIALRDTMRAVIEEYRLCLASDELLDVLIIQLVLYAGDNRITSFIAPEEHRALD